MLNPARRLIQRYLVVGPIASLIYYLRFRCMVSPQARVQYSDLITIGRGTVVKPFAIIQTNTGRITIGQRCAISSFNHLSAGEAELVIGDFTRLGPNVTIMAVSRNVKRRDALIIDQGYTHKGICIGKDVLVGAGAVILDGCRVSDGVVIGAGSVVTHDIPPYTIVAGVPAEIIGKRE